MPYLSAGRRLRQRLFGSSALLLAVVQLSACAEPPANRTLQAAPTLGAAVPASLSVAAPVAAAPAMPRSFSQWREDFRRVALATGIAAETFDRAFAGVSPDPAVIRLDRSQPEFARPVWEYLDSAVSPQRVVKGKQLLAKHAGTLRAIEQRYGVERHALVAVWGMESNFGSNMGNMSVIRSLATLAHEGRRPQFAQEQLIAALAILQHGDVRPERMQGSWAGAMGQTQFIPTTYQRHAVDFDGDGRRDIWDSTADALASTANYLRASGWQPGQGWGMEVRLPQGFDYALADPEVRKTVGEWLQLGVRPLAEQPQVNAARQQNATLLLPAGHLGPAFLVQDNFRTILKYNNSTAYALAISLLAERFDGGGQVLAGWPRGERPLSRSERIELQERLAQRGFDPGTPDGIIGANTRRAVRASQQQLGWPADGYPNHRLLEQLRQLP
ncbi:lytic murein transglycosylase [Pseudomonas oryzae]|uniref:Membrane-bound lytic murein transglycosylase B n=1 Tax=Pseudomonas oryzae TaxID=1392877 RepID=A0A1H1Z5R2_9PSED|nr:lytic murein transglycosylase [Pseudomonas oryzae]SDT28943.1 membrane-bound lytic murein transglycosylase B [Pseudomonas oryzae]